MIRAIGFLIKTCFFSVVILILGNWLKIGDRTISDQIKTQIAHAEQWKIAGKIRGWTMRFDPEHLGRQRKIKLEEAVTGSDDHSSERISPSERQKLKNLILELNRGSRS